MKKKIERRQKFIDSSKKDSSLIHCACGIMLCFLQELPNPIIPYEYFDNFVRVIEIYEKEKFNKASSLVVAINNFHDLLLTLQRSVEVNYTRNVKLLAFYFNFFYHLTKNYSVTKMSCENIAICIAPAILRSKDEMNDVLKIRVLVEVCVFLIKYNPLIFSVCYQYIEMHSINEMNSLQIQTMLFSSLNIRIFTN